MKKVPDKQKRIANALRKYRKIRGLKQHEVARILGLKSTSMISRWETGACVPDSINLLRLAALYRTMVDALFLDHIQTLRKDLAQKEESILNGKKDFYVGESCPIKPLLKTQN